MTIKLPAVKNRLLLIRQLVLHEIAKDLHIQKIKVAQDILAADKGFKFIFFLMPKGNMYVKEPYSRQLNLTKINFDFRDYHKGDASTHTTYLGNVVISASSGLPQPIWRFHFIHLKIIINNPF